MTVFLQQDHACNFINNVANNLCKESNTDHVSFCAYLKTKRKVLETSVYIIFVSAWRLYFRNYS